ncbi:MAG: glutathione S-transferase family protein [Myxococcota bacterium]|nr:glutathione S-transferase family protein [Myxococcota bacterium]
MIRLYTYAMSPYAAKVHCFLLHKRLDFEPYYINPLRVKQELPVGRQIPVLSIDGESRADSTPIGLWLDERFPDAPRLLPRDGAERERLLELDHWVTDRLIPGSFRSYPGEGLDRIRNGWKLGSVMGRTARGGIPAPLRFAWPWFVTRVAFVRRLVAQADDGLPVGESKRKLYDQFLERLEGGPFLAGRTEPSMPDLAAYPQFALFYALAFHGGDDIEERPELMAWLGRMGKHLDGEPPLVPPHVRERALPA